MRAILIEKSLALKSREKLFQLLSHLVSQNRLSILRCLLNFLLAFPLVQVNSKLLSPTLPNVSITLRHLTSREISERDLSTSESCVPGYKKENCSLTKSSISAFSRRSFASHSCPKGSHCSRVTTVS